MEFVEGTYRLGGHDWQVFIFTRFPQTEPTVIEQQWASGVSGLFVRFPMQRLLNQQAVESVLAEKLNVTSWQVVHGPDSMVLR